MNDDAQMPPRDEGSPQPPDGPSPEAGDEAALERLKALSDDGHESPPGASAVSRAKSVLRRTSAHGRPSLGGMPPARIAAPAVFLVAVIVLVVLAFHSGVIGGGPDAAVSPSPSVSSSAGASPASATTTKVYVVKRGDTLSGIAAKFDITVGRLEDLNPDMSASTLRVGQKLKVPKE